MAAGGAGWPPQPSGNSSRSSVSAASTRSCPLFIQTLGIDSPQRAGIWAGTATFSQAIMVAVFSPIWGGMADCYGGKLMVLRALYGSSLVFIVLGFVQHVWQILALFALLGCLSGVNTAIVTMV